MLLALDLASVTGFAFGEPGAQPIYGHLRPGGSRGAPIAAILDKFDNWLEDKITEVQPSYIYYEAPYIGGAANANVIQILYGMSGFVLAAGYRHKIITRRATILAAYAGFVGRLEPIKRLPQESKKALADRRRATKKAATIAACRERGWPTDSDDEADALAVFHFASCEILAGDQARLTIL